MVRLLFDTIFTRISKEPINKARTSVKHICPLVSQGMGCETQLLKGSEICEDNQQKSGKKPAEPLIKSSSHSPFPISSNVYLLKTADLMSVSRMPTSKALAIYARPGQYPY